jgi:hypothetical protein
VGAVVGENGVDLVRHRLEQRPQEVRGDTCGRFLMQLGDGELGGPVDRHEQVELTFLGADLRDVDVEVADWIGLELAPGERLCALRFRQPGDAVALEATVQRRTGQVRQRRLQGIQAVVQRQQRVPAKGDNDRLRPRATTRWTSTSWDRSADQ